MNNEAAGVRWITESVLIDRINARLADDSHQMKEVRMEGSPSFGHFYEHADSIGEFTGSIDLEAFGREMGVLAADESVAFGSASGTSVDQCLV